MFLILLILASTPYNWREQIKEIDIQYQTAIPRNFSKVHKDILFVFKRVFFRNQAVCQDAIPSFLFILT